MTHAPDGAHATGPHIPRLDISVGRTPRPGLIRPSIEAALAGRALDGGPESTLAHAVANAVSTVKAPGAGGDSSC